MIKVAVDATSVAEARAIGLGIKLTLDALAKEHAVVLRVAPEVVQDRDGGTPWGRERVRVRAHFDLDPSLPVGLHAPSPYGGAAPEVAP